MNNVTTDVVESPAPALSRPTMAQIIKKFFCDHAKISKKGQGQNKRSYAQLDLHHHHHHHHHLPTAKREMKISQFNNDLI